MDTIEEYMPHTDDENKSRLEQLKKIMPDIFTSEGQLDEKELEKIINPNIIETEHYDFRWFGKSRAKREAFTPTTATLEYDEERSVNPNNSENIIIEGENLQVLKLLKQGYRGKIKCIYIDPPYNTGKDFVYSDKWKTGKKEYFEDVGYTKDGVTLDSNPKDSGRYHSDWLSMMYSRLLASRDLLREDGVIFISIDDNEVHHLRKLCDEVFGEDNCVVMVWRKSGVGRDGKMKNTTTFRNDHEYILVVYKESKILNKSFEIPNWENSYGNPDNDSRGNYKTGSISRKDDVSDPKHKNYYTVVSPTGREITRQFEISQEEFNELENDDRIYWGKDGNAIPSQKIFENEKRYVTTSSLLNYKEATTTKGTEELDDILCATNVGKEIRPKPSFLLQKIIQISTTQESLVLDFFAGSGTTGAAVMQLNAEDGGNRKYIQVQIPEQIDEEKEAYQAGFKTISDITIERNKRVIEKITKEKQEKKEELPQGLGFKVFKLTKSNFPRVEFVPNPELSEKENVKELEKYISEKENQMNTAINRDNIITEIAIKNGMTLNYTITAHTEITDNEILVLSDTDRKILVCLDEDIKENTIAYFKNNNDTMFICLERALDSTKKWNLDHYLKDNFKSY